MKPFNPIGDIQFNADEIQLLAPAYTRTNSVIADQTRIYFSNAETGVSHFNLPRPNGLSWLDSNTLLLADMERECIETLDLTSGITKMVCNTLGGKALGKVNYAISDSKQRIWFSVSTRRTTTFEALRPDVADGYIGLIENGVARIVADGLHFANEIRLDHNEQFIYVAETTKRQITRWQINTKRELINKECFGPTHYGTAGFPDGLRFDKYGNLWLTLVMAEKIMALTPSSADLYEIYSGCNDAVAAAVDAAFNMCALTPELQQKSGCHKIPLITSIAFGGKDFQTIYIGHGAKNGIGCYQSNYSWQD